MKITKTHAHIRIMVSTRWTIYIWRSLCNWALAFSCDPGYVVVGPLEIDWF